MIPDRRRDHFHAAIVQAAIRLACDGRLERAPKLLCEMGVRYSVCLRVLSPLGERRRRPISQH